VALSKESSVFKNLAESMNDPNQAEAWKSIVDAKEPWSQKLPSEF